MDVRVLQKEVKAGIQCTEMTQKENDMVVGRRSSMYKYFFRVVLVE